MWERVAYVNVPELHQQGEPGETWRQQRAQVEADYGPLPGGSFAFGLDGYGNRWFVEWDAFGDNCLYLRHSGKKL